MKIKKSIVNLVLSKVYSNLKKVGKKVNKMIKMFKSKTCDLDNKKLFNNSKTLVEQYRDSVLVYDEVEFYYDKCDGNDIIPLETYMNSLKEDIKQSAREIKERIVDEYNGKKLFITETIKSIYYKAKNLIVAISGSLIKINKEYRDAIDRFLEVRTNIINNINDILFEKSILEFIKANNVDSFKAVEEHADILTKMYISEKDEKTYLTLNRYNTIIQFDDAISL